MCSYDNKKAAAIAAANEKIKEIDELEACSVRLRNACETGNYLSGIDLEDFLIDFESELEYDRTQALNAINK